jgi:hypothetical protein
MKSFFDRISSWEAQNKNESLAQYQEEIRETAQKNRLKSILNLAP